ncbi:hypothetical protein MN116_005623 [Schistosoma mekongi]|uniref:UDP-N-acetylglucosamine transporter n=1 Tax=Schistosoma mekongi TaxID=38744 RepID=A0AAE1ZB31_SCHME|nr:hypothetical protein MN116_005623 [Schistosoma mekongi]
MFDYLNYSTTILFQHYLPPQVCIKLHKEMFLWMDKYKFLQSDLFLGRVALLFLIVQNAAIVLVTRYSRAREGDLYFPSTAVVMSELVKLLVCFLLVFFEEKCSFVSFIHNLRDNILKDPTDCLLVSVPGVIYTIQNNLLFVGYSNLDAVSFQISYQLKIFTTAVFFRIILSKHLSGIQWCSLCVLFIGVVLTQVNGLTESNTEINKNTAETKSNLFIGLSSVILACTCSGFAGVFFEKLLKSSHKSVAVRNIQLAFYGVTAGILTVYLKDGKQITEKGFFFGYDFVVWAAILIQSLGGLLIAATIRYADNIRKGFASSLAIVLTFILSIYLFDFNPTILFYAGAILVVVATVLYSAYPSSNNHTTDNTTINTTNKINGMNSSQNFISNNSIFKSKLSV